MAKAGLIFLLLVSVVFVAKAQTRYFEFTTNCGHGNWQDTSFIAFTSDPIIIDSVLANLTRPLVQRNFINGPIDYGNGGHNHNAGHWFLWHFVPDQWDLVGTAMEICDGCPYTDVDADTAYWVGSIGVFCPWSGQPVREVSNPLGIIDKNYADDFLLYPNPASDKLNLKWSGIKSVSATIINSLGEELFTFFLSKEESKMDISQLENGFYFLKITDGNKTIIKKVVINLK